MHMHVWRVELPDGCYTLIQESGEEEAEGQLNHVCVQQDLDQSPEEPKAVFEQEGKPRFCINLFS